MRKVAMVLVSSVLMVVGAACSSSTARDVSGALARNAVAAGMKKEFSDHGHPLKGIPTCTTSSVAGSNTRMNVACTARTTAGEPVTLLGRTAGVNEVAGNFAATLNGTQLFTTDCVGC